MQLQDFTESEINADMLDAIARVCHEANRAFCRTIGDNSQETWDVAPDWQKTSAINGVRFHLMADHGPQESHENWMKEKLADGWKYGEVKDAEAKTHPCLVPFRKLQLGQAMKDIIFRNIVHSFKVIPGSL